MFVAMGNCNLAKKKYEYTGVEDCNAARNVPEAVQKHGDYGLHGIWLLCEGLRL